MINLRNGSFFSIAFCLATGLCLVWKLSLDLAVSFGANVRERKKKLAWGTLPEEWWGWSHQIALSLVFSI